VYLCKKVNKLYKKYINIMKPIKIMLTFLLLVVSATWGAQAHSISAAIATCDTIRDNRVNHVQRDREIREDRATNRMLDDIADIEAARNTAELAAWNAYNTEMASILTVYYIQEALCLAQGFSATAAACIAAAELNALVEATQALSAYNNAIAIALYNYNTAYNQIMTTWQDALEDAELLFNNAMNLVNLLHMQCINDAYTHSH
jgi:hypothetical protein